MTLAKQRKKILKQLDALKKFPNTSTVRKLRQELNEKLRRIDSRIQHGRQTKLPISKKQVKRMANAARAGKLHKYHNYIRQIHDNYPDLTYADIRRQYAERKKGKRSEIPDVIWRNPSP
ncbi:hypothetical protein [Candidatus Nitrososphaera sp. FF02]|uniref:hypothetical protein n=1 Tax=Candidatus Nitrososphaera sp. FF02 TaxID=3398226 RepID=UPI0039E75859